MISIIIPLYNVKKYLKDCLDSIQSVINQTYTDWECILVDDGSIDGSAEICDSYMQRDERFKVIHKGNGGVSSARNMGIKEARGEWIAFVDADDIISAQYLESLIEPSKQGDDLIVGGNTYFGLERGETVPPENCLIQKDDFKNYIFKDSEWTWQRVFLVVWGKLFRLSIIRNNNLYFDVNMIRSEDTTFLLLYMTLIRNVRLLSVKEYSYRYELSNKPYYKFSVDRFIAQQASYMKAMNIVCRSGIGSFKNVIDKAKLNCFILFLSSLNSQKEFIKGVREYRKIEKEYSFLYSDFLHTIYYFIIISFPSIGYYIFYRKTPWR